MVENTRKGTLSDAINSVSTADIIDSFGVPNRTRRGRTYILCPGHDDHNFGSCYIDKNDNGYYCYVCGEHVQKWEMVLKLNGNNKASACEWFFKTSGITPTTDFIEDPYKKATQLVKKIERHLKNNKVYNDLYVCEDFESSYGRNINGEYVYSEVSINNPLLELYKQDKEFFKTFVIKKLVNVENKFLGMLAKYSENKNDCLYIESVGLIPNDELEEACNKNIEAIRCLRTEIEEL